MKPALMSGMYSACWRRTSVSAFLRLKPGFLDFGTLAKCQTVRRGQVDLRGCRQRLHLYREFRFEIAAQQPVERFLLRLACVPEA